MDLDFTQEQQMLRDTARGICQQYATIDVVRAMEDDPVGYPEELWKNMAEVGLLGLTIPENYGGAGLGAIDSVVLYEEFGRTLAPSPHLVSSVLGAGAISRAGSEEQKSEWLPKVASGEAVLTPAWLEPQRGYGPVGVKLEAKADGGNFTLNGVKRHVLFARAATRLLVLARTGSGESDIDLFLVDPQSPGVTLEQQMTIASDTQYKVTFENVVVSEADRVGLAGGGWEAWNESMLDGAIMVAASAMGGAERALEMTVEYSMDRHQFDKPIGSFQSIAHYMADGATVIDGGRTLVYEAAWARSEGRDVKQLAPMAKLFACDTFRDVTAMCEQVHGGAGFTIEFDIQLYFRRAKQWQLSWWDQRYLEELIAVEVLDKPKAA